MIQEALCSSEIFNLLREKGFDGMFITNVTNDTTLLDITHQTALAWLREKGIFIELSFSLSLEEDEMCTNWIIFNKDNEYLAESDKFYPKFEDATESALRYSLENLI